MPTKIQVESVKASKPGVLKKLPRVSVKAQAFGKRLNFTYVPLVETLVKVVREKKGLVQASVELFNEFEGKSVKTGKTARKPKATTKLN